MTSRAERLAAAAFSVGSDALANAALNLARRVKPIALRRRAMTLAALSKGVLTPPPGFLIVANDDGTFEVDDDGLVYIEEAA